MSQSKLPNFIVAGVNKAGTTSVFQYLNGHPQVCCSRDKETGYFLPFRYGKPAIPVEIYKEQFLDCENSKIIMEATPGYFYGGLPLAEAIKNTVQNNCRILIILREPVSRLVSFYRAKKKNLELDRSMDLKSYVNACMNMTRQEVLLQENNKFTGVICGFYADYMDEWLSVFGENLKIMFYDDLNANPKQFMNELCSWLEIDAGYFARFNFEIENKTFAYKNRLIQQIAIGINRNAARFWRKNPMIKKWIRKQYFKVNRSDGTEVIDQDTLNFATSLYHPYNQKLKQVLTQKGINGLPAWLNA
ncbi:MAG TPA: sulfotransferase [Bacteroidia bacterium]|nr:sulfotransferase [Bacteroidia bacterium]